MGHRQLFGLSQMFESEHEQNWNHMQSEQSFGQIVTVSDSGSMAAARSGGADNSPFFCPIESIFSDGIHFSPHWNPLPRSNGYSTSSHNVEAPSYPPDVSGPSQDPFQQHPVSAGTFSTVSENYTHHHAPSSSYDRQTLQGVETGFVDLTIGNAGTHKRKSPMVPLACERGSSSSRYYGAGSSTDLPVPSELCHEKMGVDSQHMPWDRVAMNPSGYSRGSGLMIRAEGSSRNVRSRSMHDLESNLSRTQHSTYSTNQIEQPSLLDISSQPPAGLSPEWNQSDAPPRGNVIVSEASNACFLLASNSSNEVFHHDFIQNSRNSVPPSYPGTSAQSARGIRSSSYSQRPNPISRASSSNNASLRLGHSAPSDEGMQSVAESHSRHPRPLSNAGWRNVERSGRSRASHERYRSLSDETSLRDRFVPEGAVAADRSALYGSRNNVDQHREMRLDVDNMSYEELLALGERIGSVSTGVSPDLISKCITETIHCSSDQIQDEGTCVICLEEYKNMDDVGTLKTCGHDYHVECIKKWLEMKNLCPICKGPVLADNMKGK